MQVVKPGFHLYRRLAIPWDDISHIGSPKCKLRIRTQCNALKTPARHQFTHTAPIIVASAP